MDAIQSLRESLGGAHWLLGETMKGTTAEQAHWGPAGTAHPVAATYAHLVLSEDMLVNGMARGQAPLAMTSWAGKLGVSEPPPQGSEGPAPWADWARRVKVDLDAMGKYAEAVFAKTDSWIASLSPSDLDRKMETFPGFGEQSLNWVIGVIIGHANNHVGEISAIKGTQGLQGYPF